MREGEITYGASALLKLKKKQGIHNLEKKKLSLVDKSPRKPRTI